MNHGYRNASLIREGHRARSTICETCNSPFNFRPSTLEFACKCGSLTYAQFERLTIRLREHQADCERQELRERFGGAILPTCDDLDWRSLADRNCPICRSPGMVIKKLDTWFLGCRHYPNCKGTIALLSDDMKELDSIVYRWLDMRRPTV